MFFCVKISFGKLSIIILFLGHHYYSSSFCSSLFYYIYSNKLIFHFIHSSFMILNIPSHRQTGLCRGFLCENNILKVSSREHAVNFTFSATLCKKLFSMWKSMKHVRRSSTFGVVGTLLIITLASLSLLRYLMRIEWVYCVSFVRGLRRTVRRLQIILLCNQSPGWKLLLQYVICLPVIQFTFDNAYFIM